MPVVPVSWVVSAKCVELLLSVEGRVQSGLPPAVTFLSSPMCFEESAGKFYSLPFKVHMYRTLNTP